MNADLDLLLTTVLMVWLASLFLTGDQLIRGCAWIICWQLLSPDRPPSIDIPLLLLSGGVLEVSYLCCKDS
ncbi:hypothetical protein [Parathalassolituus penaei]|uniref:Uncharacterized protein n=1 Tax=Parathalassolituus penaei TaxID=2997323 RepID=A0A9X3IUG5_9GAMM|nr:hypothetical protein [Parathalassolituus penaei]MCY0966143.1 hypothetical protein [Parathalassolituus penaei]